LLYFGFIRRRFERLSAWITGMQCIYSKPLHDKSLVVCKLSQNCLREVKAAQALSKGSTLLPARRAEKEANQDFRDSEVPLPLLSGKDMA
jgi:hypothetical protein